MGRKKKKKNQNKVIGIIILIIAVLLYAKMTVFKDTNPLNDFSINWENPFKRNIEVTERSVTEDFSQTEDENLREEDVFVDIFFTKSTYGKDVYMAASRKKPKNYNGSNVEFAVKSLLQGVTKYEKEIPRPKSGIGG